MRALYLLPATVLVACASNTPAEMPADAGGVTPELAAAAQVDEQRAQEDPIEAPGGPSGGNAREATDEPAPGPFPSPPDTDRPEGERPRAAALGPDASVVGRLTEEGLVARIDFEADAGQLSLFELTSWGYTRGWTSRSALIIRDETGAEVARSERGGGTVYQDVLPFIAAEDGTFSLDVVAVESGFRYRVIRHTGYSPSPAGDRVRVGARDVTHGWIEGADDSVTFVVEGTPGETVALRAEPTTDRGVKQKRQLRRRLLQAEAGFVDTARLRERLGPRARDDGSFPDLVLDLDDAVEVAGHGHAAVARVPSGGSFDVTVRRVNEGPPGLFDLQIERALELTHVDIRVGDDEDDPVANAEVALFREPGLDLVALTVTGADGLAGVQVPAGDYTLVFRGPSGPPSTLRTRLTGDAVNLVLTRP